MESFRRFLGLSVLLVAIYLVSVSASTCADDYERVLNGSYPYAKVLIDATGRGPEDLGNHRECRLVSDVANYCVLVGEKAINGTVLPFGAGSVPIALGVCAPKSCNVTEIMTNLRDSMSIYGLNASVYVSGTCLDPAKPLPAKSWAVLAFVGFLVLVVLVGSLIGALGVDKKDERILPQATNSVQAGDGDSEIDSLVKKVAVPRAPMGARIKYKIYEILVQFSLPRNMRSFSAVTRNDLSALNGLRVFAMLWIIFGHTGEFYVEFIVNRAYVSTFIQHEWLYQIFPGAYWNVDTFFYLSGFLVAYGTMSELEKRKGRLSWPLFYIHRLWRLWPTYLFVLMMYMHLSIYVGEGFLWDNYTQYIVQRCDKWWTNALFINNFYPVKFEEQCLGWSWYLANDMQFYIISPIILYVYYRWPRIGWSLLAVIMAVSMGLNAGLMILFDVANANPIATYAPDYMDNIYAKPYCRIAPFLIGIAFAWIYLKRGRDAAPMTLGRRIAIYVAAFVLMYTPVFLVNVHANWTDVEGLLYATAGRLSWPLGVALLMHSCFCAPESFVNRIFAADIWGPLARLTFVAYLAHPVILFTYYLNRDHLLIYTDSDLVFWWIAAVAVSYLTSFAVSMLVEKPVLNLEKVIFGGGGKAHSRTPVTSATQPLPAPGGNTSVKADV